METLLQRRSRLIAARAQMQVVLASYRYGQQAPGQPVMVPPEYAEQIYSINRELEVVDQAVLTSILGIIEKLPRCEDCQETATRQIKLGPFLCEAHAAEHPTARQVPWFEELRRLGLA